MVFAGNTSSGWLFLNGLRSRRARFHFTSRAQNALQWSGRSSNVSYSIVSAKGSTPSTNLRKEELVLLGCT